MTDTRQPWTSTYSEDIAVALESGLCANCKRDNICNGTVRAEDAKDDDMCPILAAAYRGEAKELFQDQAAEFGVICTQFEAMDGTVKPRWIDGGQNDVEMAKLEAFIGGPAARKGAA